ncbi:MAG: DUF4249 family protein [Saprospiraceae bacterium]|nr:DUF4249 family protein [Saprospiraceae bacterium]
MKKLLLLIPFIALLWSSCSNDFDVTAPWKEVPVVYAMLSPKDTANYIRVEKAFLDPEQSALLIAQIADSLYYPASAIQVFLERVSTGERYTCVRVDGNLEGFVREGGIFATQPNWLYKYKAPGEAQKLQAGEAYRVVIERTDGQAPITGETTLPKDFFFIKPNPSQTPPTISINNPDVPTTIEWRTSEEGVYFNLTLRIRYRETDMNGAFIGRDSFDWRAVSNVRRTDVAAGVGGFYRGLADLGLSAFHNALLDSISTTNSKIRYFEKIDIILEGGGAEIEEYLNTANANSGITGAEIVQLYSNMSEGYGIVTGLNTSRLNECRFSPQTVDAMNDNPETKALNFRN